MPERYNRGSGLKINNERIKYVLIFDLQNAGQNRIKCEGS
jgi:hypothetical protein